MDSLPLRFAPAGNDMPQVTNPPRHRQHEPSHGVCVSSPASAAREGDHDQPQRHGSPSRTSCAGDDTAGQGTCSHFVLDSGCNLGYMWWCPGSPRGALARRCWLWSLGDGPAGALTQAPRDGRPALGHGSGGSPKRTVREEASWLFLLTTITIEPGCPTRHPSTPTRLAAHSCGPTGAGSDAASLQRSRPSAHASSRRNGELVYPA
jgi:hypothetical protein